MSTIEEADPKDTLSAIESRTVHDIGDLPPAKLEGPVLGVNGPNEAELVRLEGLYSAKIEGLDKSLGRSADENQRLICRKLQNGYREIRQAIGLMRAEIRLIEVRQGFIDTQMGLFSEVE